MTRRNATLDAVRGFLDGTRTVDEIAALSGVSSGSIRSLIHRRGWHAKVRSIYRKAPAKPIPVVLPDTVRRWVEAMCPTDLRPEEMIAAIVTDAYHEEKK